MSVINKKPFIKSLLESLSDSDLQTLSTLIDGGGNQTPLRRTANPNATSAAPHLSTDDKGVHLCNLTVNYTNFLGYLVYNDDYCVLIWFTDSQVLKCMEIDPADSSVKRTVNEELNVLELRSVLYETAGGSGSGGGGTTPTDTRTNEQKLQAMLQLLHTFDNENPAAFDETFEFEAFRYADIVDLLEHPESPFVFDAGFGALFDNEDIWYAMRDGKFQILDVYSRATINDLTSDQYRPTAYSVEIPYPTIIIMDDDEPHDCLVNLRYVFDTGDSNIYEPSDNDLFTFKIRFKYDPNPVEPINPK